MANIVQAEFDRGRRNSLPARVTVRLFDNKGSSITRHVLHCARRRDRHWPGGTKELDACRARMKELLLTRLADAIKGREHVALKKRGGLINATAAERSEALQVAQEARDIIVLVLKGHELLAERFNLIETFM